MRQVTFGILVFGGSADDDYRHCEDFSPNAMDELWECVLNYECEVVLGFDDIQQDVFSEDGTIMTAMDNFEDISECWSFKEVKELGKEGLAEKISAEIAQFKKENAGKFEFMEEDENN